MAPCIPENISDAKFEPPLLKVYVRYKCYCSQVTKYLDSYTMNLLKYYKNFSLHILSYDH